MFNFDLQIVIQRRKKYILVKKLLAERIIVRVMSPREAMSPRGSLFHHCLFGFTTY